ERYVTLVNPDPAKGGLFFLNLAAQVKAMAPEIRFRAVESRWGRANWEKLHVPAEHLDAIDWYPTTSDMGQVYSEAALLVMPSLWVEAAGRVIPEAQLSGVPVLATRSGGIPEQVGEGGFLFDIPEGMSENYFATPPAEAVQHWAKFVAVLMRDDSIYARAVDLALKAAEAHAPEARAGEIVAAFNEILERPVLESIGTDPAVQTHLAALRKQMNELREAVNATLDSAPQTSAEGDEAGEEDPYTEVLTRSLAQPAVRDALSAAKVGDHDKVRAILEQYLRLMPEDIVALGILADTADKQERDGEARRLMERVVELAPGFVAGQQQLVRYLRHAGDAEAALRHSFALLERAPHQPRYLALHANLLTNANRFDEAIDVYEGFFANHKGVAQDWMQYALALKTLGRQEDAVAAYREAIARAPGNGAAWHALSNMKLAVFTDDDIALMEEQLCREDLGAEDRYNIHFTLGKAYEDRKAYAPSFENYAQANGIRRAQSDYDISRLEDYVAEAKEVFTKDFFAARQDFGSPEADPIFVVGLHRAGSTLTEQILSSHSQIEGTRELPDLLRIGRDFGGLGPGGQEASLNKRLLADLDAEECAALGQKFLDSTRAERRTDRPYFIDKMPANWMYAGLIHLILPNAKIIDIRRKPMAAGFALFKMNFGRGVDHSYDQKDIARYYRAYTELMAHFDEVLPGRIHHLQYEALVDTTDAEIRRLLDYCDLPFEEQCLRYWETERAVQTPSSEQVRKPIFKDAVEQWRNYAEWLGPMQEIFAQMPVEDMRLAKSERA
uniref:sulfotransferase n=1 Tax=uncultured Thiohalocapsa sp. TaxID=768990 RepID=UPI002600107F